MKTLTIQCQLTDTEMQTLAVGLGWQDTKTVIDENTRAWENVPNDVTHGDFIVNHFVELIKSATVAVLVKQQKVALAAELEKQAVVLEAEAQKTVDDKLTGAIA
jgi:hypothetical protein